MFGLSLAQIAFLALVIIAAISLAAGLTLLIRRSQVAERLDTIIAPGGTIGKESTARRDAWVESFVKAAKPLARVSVPDEGWESSAIRRRFMHAGFRGESAPILFFAIKTALALLFPLLLWLYKGVTGWDPRPQMFVSLLVLCLAVGFYLPNFVLNRMIQARQREIFESFPDAIDLLTICVEAGLGLDAAIARVGTEMRLKSQVLSDELELVSLELRAGAGKERALRNLALRTGVEDIDTLVAMLIQSEKFGTSVGDSLRIHSDMLRVKRQQRAEETAAKIAVKLVLPLVLFIFPSILIVVAGPAMIQIGKSMSSIFGGG